MNKVSTFPGNGGIAFGVLCMAAVVACSNFLVQFPVTAEQVPGWFSNFTQQYLGIAVHELLTWGAFTYPIAFLVNDLTNRKLGTSAARIVVIAGFIVAVILSIWLATPRIALASGLAFLAAQFIDTGIFSSLRHGPWWRAPVVSSCMASIVDTLLFFSIAFVGSGLPWMTWALGDYAVKILVALIMLIPFRLMIGADNHPLINSHP